MIKYLIILTTCISFAQINTDRPNNTESSLVVPSGASQIETGYQLVTESMVDFANQNGFILERSPAQIQTFPFTIFRVGLYDWIELRAVHSLSQNDVIGNDSYSNDLEIGTKIQLLNKSSDKFKIAFIGHLILPTGYFTDGSDLYGIYSKLALSNELSNRFSIAYNIGFRKIEATEFIEMLSTATVAYSVNSKSTIMFELFTNSMHEEFTTNDANLGGTFSFTYLINDNLQVDFVLGTRVSGSGFYKGNSNYFGLGLSWIIPKD